MPLERMFKVIHQGAESDAYDCLIVSCHQIDRYWQISWREQSSVGGLFNAVNSRAALFVSEGCAEKDNDRSCVSCSCQRRQITTNWRARSRDIRRNWGRRPTSRTSRNLLNLSLSQSAVDVDLRNKLIIIRRALWQCTRTGALSSSPNTAKDRRLVRYSNDVIVIVNNSNLLTTLCTHKSGKFLRHREVHSLA